MDIIIPLGRFSKCGDLEIKYCLRGIEKNLTGWDKIFIIGYAPKFLNDTEKVVIIPAEDRTIRKELNIFTKVIKACEDPFISDPFMFMNDDHFIQKTVDTSEIKNWAWHDLKILLAMGQGVYKIAVKNTFEFLKANNLRLHHFDLHLPIIYRKELFMNLMQVDWSQKDYLIKSLYGNINKVQVEPYSDLNISPQIRPAEKIKQAIETRRIFAYSGNDGMSESMLNVLNELFPNKSSFEK